MSFIRVLWFVRSVRAVDFQRGKRMVYFREHQFQGNLKVVQPIIIKLWTSDQSTAHQSSRNATEIEATIDKTSSPNRLRTHQDIESLTTSFVFVKSCDKLRFGVLGIPNWRRYLLGLPPSRANKTTCCVVLILTANIYKNKQLAESEERKAKSEEETRLYRIQTQQFPIFPFTSPLAYSIPVRPGRIFLLNTREKD